MVRVIARIPDVSERQATPAVGGGGASRSPGRPRPRGGILTGFTDSLPTWPLAALAILAVVTWVLASWNDQIRLERQRREMRVAREPAAGRDAPAAGSDGAVVR